MDNWPEHKLIGRDNHSVTRCATCTVITDFSRFTNDGVKITTPPTEKAVSFYQFRYTVTFVMNAITSQQSCLIIGITIKEAHPMARDDFFVGQELSTVYHLTFNQDINYMKTKSQPQVKFGTNKLLCIIKFLNLTLPSGDKWCYFDGNDKKKRNTTWHHDIHFSQCYCCQKWVQIPFDDNTAK